MRVENLGGRDSSRELRAEVTVADLRAARILVACSFDHEESLFSHASVLRTRYNFQMRAQ